MVTLNSIFTNGMIMQANKPIRVFGEGEGVVTVSFLNKIKSTESSGKWMLEFDSVDYGGPYEMKVALDDEIRTIENIHFGDVYLLSGQSNIQFKLKESNEPIENYKGNEMVRLYTVDRMEEGEHFLSSDGWVECTKENAGDFSAIGYYVGQGMTKKNGHMVGLIACYQGASVIQSWIKKEIALLPELQTSDKFWDHRAFPIWNGEGTLYENMLSKIIPFSLGAVIWYQGESNASDGEARLYLSMLEHMIDSWREDFIDTSLPFVVIQMADHDDRDGYAWSTIQRAQLEIEKTTPFVKSVMCRDVCDHIDIHPKEKDILSSRVCDAL